MTKVYLSVGSNIEPEKNIRFGLAQLEQAFGHLHRSKIYQNQAVGFDGNDFYNLVVGLKTSHDIETTARILKNIEQASGRKPQEKKFSPRTLDIDILLFGEYNFHPQRDIPRKEITQYIFVLQPLAEIAPKIIHPTLNKTIQELWDNRDAQPPLSSVVTL